MAALPTQPRARAPAQSAGRASATAGSVNLRPRLLAALGVLLAALAVVSGQLVRLAMKEQPEARVSMAEPIARIWSRPDIVDRHGRLIATDVATPSLYADPHLMLDIDEAAEKLAEVLPALEAAELRRLFADRNRRFVWVARGLAPRQAQRVHELGLPGLAFRSELKRVYPLGTLAGHVIGSVNTDNRGISGLERMLDATGRVEAVQGLARTSKPALRLSIDIAAQHALTQELKSAKERYRAAAAAAVILDAGTGEIAAAVSLPEVDPAHPADWLDTARADRLVAGVYELGSIFKVVTVAAGLELGVADLDKVYDVRPGLGIGQHTIKDPGSGPGRPLSVREIFLHSSNVGAALLAQEIGAERQRAFLAKLGLTDTSRLDLIPIATPLLPRQWGAIETATIGFGHGLALAPLQFAGAFASLVNGGLMVTPTLLAGEGEAKAQTQTKTKTRVVSAATSERIREILRLNVTHASGTGRRAEVEGYRVGGKTGTAEMPGRGGYQEKAVISSFIAAFPMDAPRYVSLVLLFEPQTGEGTPRIVASVNAAPATARIIERVAPILGVSPRSDAPGGGRAVPFDAPAPAQ